jgi:hypothetical protein
MSLRAFLLITGPRLRFTAMAIEELGFKHLERKYHASPSRPP